MDVIGIVIGEFVLFMLVIHCGEHLLYLEEAAGRDRDCQDGLDDQYTH